MEGTCEEASEWDRQLRGEKCTYKSALGGEEEGVVFFWEKGVEGKVKGGRNFTFGLRRVGLLQASDWDVASSLDLRGNGY